MERSNKADAFEVIPLIAFFALDHRYLLIVRLLAYAIQRLLFRDLFFRLFLRLVGLGFNRYWSIIFLFRNLCMSFRWFFIRLFLALIIQITLWNLSSFSDILFWAFNLLFSLFDFFIFLLLSLLYKLSFLWLYKPFYWLLNRLFLQFVTDVKMNSHQILCLSAFLIWGLCLRRLLVKYLFFLFVRGALLIWFRLDLSEIINTISMNLLDKLLWFSPFAKTG